MFDALDPSFNLFQDNSNAADPIAVEALFESAADLQGAYESVDQLTAASDTINDLAHLISVVNEYGISKSLIAFTNRDKILSSNFPKFSACESLNADVDSHSMEAVALQEELKASVESMVGDWFKKAWDVVSNLGSKIWDYSKAAAMKIADAASWAGGKIYDAAKAAKNVIVAHPVASAFAALALVASTVALVGAIWGIPLPATAEALASWKSTISAKVSSVFKGKAKVGEQGPTSFDFANEQENKAKQGTGSSLGYLKDKFNGLCSEGKALFSEGGRVNTMAKTVSSKAKALYDAAMKSGVEPPVVEDIIPEKQGYIRQAISWLVRITASLWRFVSSGPMSVFTNVMSTFRQFFSSKKKAEPSVNEEMVTA